MPLNIFSTSVERHLTSGFRYRVCQRGLNLKESHRGVRELLDRHFKVIPHQLNEIYFPSASVEDADTNQKQKSNSLHCLLSDEIEVMLRAA